MTVHRCVHPVARLVTVNGVSFEVCPLCDTRPCEGCGAHLGEPHAQVPGVCPGCGKAT